LSRSFKGPALLAALLAAPLSAAAAPAGSVEACLESAALQPRTVFDVVVSSYPTVVERRLNIPEINRIRPVQLPPKAIAHGLTMAHFSLRYNVKNEATSGLPGGRVCAWIGSVVVNLTPDAVRIYIPKEYAPNSCESKQLMLHEKGHERLFRRGLENAIVELRYTLAHAENLPGPLTPIIMGSPAGAYARLKLMVDKVVRPFYEDFLAKTRLEQESLDDPETYRRLGDSCAGWKRT
jgi:hypothetical protein